MKLPDNGINSLIIPQPITGGKPIDQTYRSGTVNKKTGPESGYSFEKVLSAELGKKELVKISAHAEKRLLERNVAFNGEDMRKIEGAMEMAASKGARESLLMYGDVALVASIKNKTIITAMGEKDMKEHVFTNIDSAVIINR